MVKNVMNSVEKEKPPPQTIDELNEWGYKAAIFRAALELEVWEKVAAGKDTSEQLAATEGWDPFGTRMMLDALCSLRLLNKHDDSYSLVPEAEYYLLPDKPTYRGNFVLTELMWEGNGQLAEAIRTGKRPIYRDFTIGAMADHWVADYAGSWVSPERNVEQFDALWQALDIQPRDGLKVLDVACGPGRKSLSLARRHPGVQVTLLDWPQMLQVAKGVAAALGVEKQVTTIAGDLWTEDYGSNQYDIVWLGNITHFFSPEDNARLLRKSHDALAPGGVVIINSMVRRDGAPSLLWIALWLYATSPCGDAYSFQDYKDMLEDAGFVNIQNVSSQLIKATSPQMDQREYYI